MQTLKKRSAKLPTLRTRRVSVEGVSQTLETLENIILGGGSLERKKTLCELHTYLCKLKTHKNRVRKGRV